MAKEFDIYLQMQLLEHDLLVYSIPYLDGISVTNRLILETVLKRCLLRKFAAVQAGTSIESNIDQMLKRFVEKLELGTKLGASAKFEKHAKLYIENNPIIIDTKITNVSERVFNNIEGELALDVEPLVTQASSSTGRGDFPVIVDANVSNSLKHSLLNLKNTVFTNAEIDQINQVDYIDADESVVIDSTLQNLCYNLTITASASMEIVALVLGTEIYYSLGGWYSGLTLNSKVIGSWAQKLIVTETIINIGQEVTENLIKVLYPNDSEMVIGIQDFNADMKRYRLLNELDDLRLADIDDMTLEELDYVWLT